MAMGNPGMLLAACSADAVVTAVAVAAGGTRRLVLAIVIVSFGVLAAAIVLHPPAALANAGIAWLLFDGFIVGRHAVLGWDGTRELWWAAALAGAAVCGIAIGRVLGTGRPVSQPGQRRAVRRRSRAPGAGP